MKILQKITDYKSLENSQLDVYDGVYFSVVVTQLYYTRFFIRICS